MPIYRYKCIKCNFELEIVQVLGATTPSHCGEKMIQLPTFPAMVKIKGEGGYPSRRKFVKGSAPYTSRDTKAWLDTEPKT